MHWWAQQSKKVWTSTEDNSGGWHHVLLYGLEIVLLQTGRLCSGWWNRRRGLAAVFQQLRTITVVDVGIERPVSSRTLSILFSRGCSNYKLLFFYLMCNNIDIRMCNTVLMFLNNSIIIDYGLLCYLLRMMLLRFECFYRLCYIFVKKVLFLCVPVYGMTMQFLESLNDQRILSMVKKKHFTTSSQERNTLQEVQSREDFTRTNTQGSPQDANKARLDFARKKTSKKARPLLENHYLDGLN